MLLSKNAVVALETRSLRVRGYNHLKQIISVLPICHDSLFDYLHYKLAAVAITALRTFTTTRFTTARFTITCLTTFTLCHSSLLFPSNRQFTVTH